MNFKIIGLRILEGCNSRFKKNLKENIFYNFLNEYEFNLDFENEIESILYTPTIPENFYTINNKNYNGQINISAIVGSNGSGKSNLLELFIASVLIISYKLKNDFLDLNKFAEENSIDINDLKSDFDDLEKINIEIIYKSTSINRGSDLVNKIKLLNGQVIYCEFGLNIRTKNSPNIIYYKNFDFLEVEEQVLNEGDDLSLFVLKNLCYTNYINYSLHSLNSKTEGVWLDTIFHKNDGYQLPIVINPYRNKGIIDVNNENFLNINRFLINIIQYKNLRNVNGKTIKTININIDDEKIKKSIIFLKNLNRDDKYLLIKKLFNVVDFYINLNNKRFEISDIYYDELAIICIDYIIYKLIKISQTVDYIEYKNFYSNNKLSIELINFENFIEKIILDQSHHTLKLKQAINFLVFRQIDNSMLDSEINIDTLNEKLLTAYRSQNPDYQQEINFYPLNFFLPSFFKFEINFEDEFKFNSLSSGEKHKLYILHSIIYHIRNIISRKSSDNISYKNINIILDEVELYLHPEYQRTLISDLIRHINLINLDDTNINIIFATHSPFILSDIPSQNVLKLKEGEPNFDSNKLNSLGANIHDMLADEFFLNSGSKGGYIDGLINDFLIFYHGTLLNIVKKDFDKVPADDIMNKINFYELVFQNIGDEVIQGILLNNINALTEQLNEIKDV